jgi:hypothetical protein
VDAEKNLERGAKRRSDVLKKIEQMRALEGVVATLSPL